jgi:sugar phosphate isomerase/epimerase
MSVFAKAVAEAWHTYTSPNILEATDAAVEKLHHWLMDDVDPEFQEVENKELSLNRKVHKLTDEIKSLKEQLVVAKESTN